MKPNIVIFCCINLELSIFILRPYVSFHLPAVFTTCKENSIHCDNTLSSFIEESQIWRPSVSTNILGLFLMKLFLSYQEAFFKCAMCSHCTKLCSQCQQCKSEISLWFLWNTSDLTKQMRIRLQSRVKLFHFNFILSSGNEHCWHKGLVIN